MAYELKQELKLSQNLVMTPQLQMAIRLLQLGRLELVDTIKEELQTNPVLEETVDTDSSSAPEPEPPSPEVDWQAYLEDQSSGSAPSINFNRADEDQESPIGNVSSAPESLADHLMWQLSVSGLSEDDQRIGEYIIGNIGDDGYLRIVDRGERGSMTDSELEGATVREVAEYTGAEPADVERVLSVIQQFDPAGVGSRHLKECLMTQALMCPVRDTLVEEIIGHHLEDLARHDLRKIAKALGAEVEEVVEAAATINRCLNPTPGSGYGTDQSSAIIPDVYINKVGDEYVITLNEDGMPKLKVSNYYRELLKADGQVTDQAKGYIQDKLRSAMWLIKSVHQRQRTIYRVVECIVKFQKDFLDKGLKYLRPLVLKDVAAEIEVHESTVSRVTSNKYVQTPRGIFELKYFFSSAVSSSSDGDDMTAEYIKERIKAILKDEDPRKPLSDQQIVEALAAEGIRLARRTAAKYRESMGFLSSSRRKVRY